MKPEDTVRLNNELLKVDEPQTEEEKTRPKRNSKEHVENPQGRFGLRAGL